MGECHLRLTDRACLVRVRVGVILYASVHEKEVPNGPLRRGMGLPESSFPAIEVAG